MTFLRFLSEKKAAIAWPDAYLHATTLGQLHIEVQINNINGQEA
jgi:hypothetical protein